MRCTFKEERSKHLDKSEAVFLLLFSYTEMDAAQYDYCELYLGVCCIKFTGKDRENEAKFCAVPKLSLNLVQLQISI